LSPVTCATSTETDFEQYAWDTFLLAPMNAGCLAFVVQTRDLKFTVDTFARLAHSPRTTHRANRMYLLLPSVPLPEAILEADVKELYHMRQLDFMPDLVIARLVTGRTATHTGLSSGESAIFPCLLCSVHARTLKTSSFEKKKCIYMSRLALTIIRDLRGIVCSYFSFGLRILENACNKFEKKKLSIVANPLNLFVAVPSPEGVFEQLF
jgi:hypothetical protein